MRIGQHLRHLFVSAIGLVLLATSCGLPIDEQPRSIATDRLPRSQPAPVATVVRAAEASQLKIYMVRPEGPDSRNQLIFVERVIEPQPEAILNQLLIGPNPDERSDLGLSSALTGRATFAPTSVDETARIAYVGLTEGSLRGVVAEDQRLAFAQIVFSLVQLPDIESVVFSLGGNQVAVPTDTGTSAPGAELTIADFESSYPRPSVQFGLSPEETPTATTFTPPILQTDRPARPTAELFLWLVDPGGQLVAVVRDIERSPEAIVANLTAGPNAEEARANIRSALPPDTYVNNGSDIDLDESTGTIIVDLGLGSLPSLADDEKLRAVGQIVMSLTGLAEISQVSFYQDGTALSVPTDSGVSRPAAAVGRDDFASLLPATFPAPDPLPVASNAASAPVEPTTEAVQSSDPTSEADTAGAESVEPAATDGTPVPTSTPAASPTPSSTPAPSLTATSTPTPTPTS